MPLDARHTLFRWAGGKRRLVRYLTAAVPVDYRHRFYREPFLGAASLYFALRPPQADLSDLNRDLIEALKEICFRPELVARYLRDHAANDSEKYYYAVRDAYNAATTYSAAQAARFVYLNRTCFNGIFRVNRANGFNVPYGKLKTPLFPSRAHLSHVASTLGGAGLFTADYEDALEGATAGDFVYLDPPYPPLNGTSFFRHYTPERFGEEDQIRLAQCVAELTDRGCLVMMSNADMPGIRKLYAKCHVATIPVTRHVSSKNKKHEVQELLITNYLPPLANGR